MVLSSIGVCVACTRRPPVDTMEGSMVRVADVDIQEVVNELGVCEGKRLDIEREQRPIT